MLNLADRNDRVLLMCAGLVASMLGASYAAVPLYNLYCRVTGFGGTTGVAVEAPSRILDRVVTVRFDSNVDPGLDWSFEPLQRTMDVRIGEVGLAFFRVTNHSSRPIVGHATYNVTPDKAGGFFEKIQCFCFEDQTLKAGQSIEFPVVYFVDPKMADSDKYDDVSEITLSYTFFPAAGADIADAASAQ